MKAKRFPITQELLCELLRYEPETGKLYWRERGDHLFKDSKRYPAERNAKVWNTRFAGKEAFTANIEGYPYGHISVRMNVGMYRAHRVIWIMVYGVEPIEIDHINGNRFDNRLVNLRNVGRTDNARNLPISARNTHGAIGVYPHPRNGRWRASIGSKHIGYFATKDEAIAARKKAEKQIGFHPNHGRDKH